MALQAARAAASADCGTLPLTDPLLCTCSIGCGDGPPCPEGGGAICADGQCYLID